jgi:hypothetical protein
MRAKYNHERNKPELGYGVIEETHQKQHCPRRFSQPLTHQQNTPLP